MPEFEKFPKIPRLNRDIVVTEKIDGTNAAIVVEDEGVFAQSRSRLITPANDNAGFARWVEENADELKSTLGYGLHFGEWWGQGIQRRYGMDKKVFSLFNTKRWEDLDSELVRTVPVLYQGLFSEYVIKDSVDQLAKFGSRAAPGFMDPEGVIVYHIAANQMFKVTIKDDEKPKGSKEIG